MTFLPCSTNIEVCVILKSIWIKEGIAPRPLAGHIRVLEVPSNVQLSHHSSLRSYTTSQGLPLAHTVDVIFPLPPAAPFYSESLFAFGTCSLTCTSCRSLYCSQPFTVGLFTSTNWNNFSWISCDAPSTSAFLTSGLSSSCTDPHDDSPCHCAPV